VRPPTLVAHADWGSSPSKRWIALAGWRDGRYRAEAPRLVGPPEALLDGLLETAGGGSALLGVDFPIGVPAAWAARAGVQSFLELLPRLGAGEWSEFYRAAERPGEITLLRPFYPQRPGAARRDHLTARLDLDWPELRRVCDRPQPHRRAACPLFWTLGPQQVGKAAISGWRDVLAPALASPCPDVALWPFAGPLEALIRPGRVVVAETYPAEVYHQLGVGWPRPRPGQRSGKGVQADRMANAPHLVAAAAGVELAPALADAITTGFGSSADGEERFDATVGLFGMLNVVLSRRPEGAPGDPHVRAVEGWILGLSSVRHEEVGPA
jgi:hypothetical protein